MYPDAGVIAADIAPVPPRSVSPFVYLETQKLRINGRRVFPSNVKFVQVDLTKDLPFVPGTYDVVHMRLVLVHVSLFYTFLTLACRIV
jgi:Methyltransferase domain